MRLVHIADTHLGLATFNKIDSDGMNLREKLLYDNFLAGIDTIIQLKPDAIVHAGDLFDHVKPKTKSYTTVLEALERLHASGIPLIVITGNHSMVKTRYTISPFSVLEYHASELYVAYQYRYKRIELGETVFHLIPNMLRAEDYRKAFDELEFSPQHYNVMVTHGLTTSLRDKRLKTVAEHEIDSTMLSDQFDYIALGHYHGQKQVGERAWYSGSLEYLSYGEIDDRKGGLIVDLARGEVVPLSLPCTPMLHGGSIDCSNKTPHEISDEISGLLSLTTLPDNSMVQLTLEFLTRPKRKEIDYNSLHGTFERFLDVKIRMKVLEENTPIIEQRELHEVDYLQEFSSYVKKKGYSPEEEVFVSETGKVIFENILHEHREQKYDP